MSMTRRTALIEEEFDDDTDLPLPNKPLPNTGMRGAILEEIGRSDSEGDDSDAPGPRQPTAGPASPSLAQFRPSGGVDAQNSVQDITPYKRWTCIYPIYIDAKRPCGRGERRIPRAKSVWWPLSKDIADATSRLGLGTLHEVNKSHPRDWENPGRVRVQWKKDGRLMNPAIKTKKQLLEMIALQIQMLKPDSVPKAPYNTDEPVQALEAPPSTPSKGKQPAKASTKLTAGSGSVSNTTISPSPGTSHRKKTPVPPQPWPTLTSRVSPYSPSLPSGVLIDAVKAGMSAQEVVPGVPAGGGKGKRKVVRVRA